MRALLLDLAWRARSNGANGALLRGRADEERKAIDGQGMLENARAAV